MGNCRSWRSTEQSYRGNSRNCKTRAAKRGRRPPGSVEYLNFGFSLINQALSASRRTETKTDPLTSSFWNGKRCNLSTIACFFFQAEDGIRDYKVTGVQTCALPI